MVIYSAITVYPKYGKNDILVNNITYFTGTGVSGYYEVYKNYNDRPGYKRTKRPHNYMFYKRGAGYVVTSHWRGDTEKNPFKAFLWMKQDTWQCPYDINPMHKWWYYRKLREVKGKSGWNKKGKVEVRCTRYSSSSKPH